MIHATLLFLLVAALAAEPEQPLDIDKVEKEEVRLMILDAIVVDGDGRTVPDLTLEDFEVVNKGGRRVPVDTLDVSCDAGRADDPRSVRRADERRPPAAATNGRKIVLALDYLHLPQLLRADVLDQAQAMVEHGAGPGDEFMVAALNGGLRIEQAFTSDTEKVVRTLRRMQYDITLWEPSFVHLNERSFVDGTTMLFEVLGAVPGPKAVVLYSTMADVPLDSEFANIAGIAAASRCSIYPVDADGLRPPEPPGARAGRPG